VCVLKFGKDIFLKDIKDIKDKRYISCLQHPRAVQAFCSDQWSVEVKKVHGFTPISKSQYI
jgi:hypothetical protein